LRFVFIAAWCRRQAEQERCATSTGAIGSKVKRADRLRLAGYTPVQEASYWALPLGPGLDLWGVDRQLRDADFRQRVFFAERRAEAQPSQILLVAPDPALAYGEPNEPGTKLLVPYLGSFFGVLVPVGFGLLQFGASSDLLVLLSALAVVQLLIGNVLDPYLMGNSLNLSPFGVLFSLAPWSALWGVSGAFVAVPVTWPAGRGVGPPPARSAAWLRLALWCTIRSGSSILTALDGAHPKEALT